MKIQTTAQALTKTLRGHVVERKSTIPVLAYALVCGNHFITTDLDNCCISMIDGHVEKDTNFLIPCRLIERLFKDQTGPLEIKYESAAESDDPKGLKTPRVKISHDGGTFALNTMATTHFPTVPPVPMLTMEFNGAEFKKAIDRTIFAIAVEESRYTLNAALLKGDGKTLTMVATDGHRLSIVDMNNDAVIPKGVLIPRSALVWLKENIDGYVSFGANDDSITFKTGSKTLICRKTKGEFPKWESVIPTQDKIALTATFPSVERLRSILSRIYECAEEQTGKTVWHFGPETNITAKSSEGNISFPIDCNATGELTIAWSGQYIMDLLSIVDDGELRIELQDNTTAAIFYLDGMRYLAMPMRH